MTTDRQLAANRANAQHSTGPRTAHGKAISSRNNTRHGLRSTTPVIPRLESHAAWQQHRDLTIEGLAPANPFEEALAERVALILWRLGRVTSYERDVTARAREQANDDLSEMRAALHGLAPKEAAGHVEQACVRFAQSRHWLRALTSLPYLAEDAPLAARDAAAIIFAIDEQLPNLDVTTISAPGIVPDGVRAVDVQDWTVGRLLCFIQVIADAAGRDAQQLRTETLRAVKTGLNEDRAVYERLARQLHAVHRERVLPQPVRADHLIRYERHLNRQLTQALLQLERVQRARRAASQHDRRSPTAASSPRPTLESIGVDHLPPALAELAVLLRERPLPIVEIAALLEDPARPAATACTALGVELHRSPLNFNICHSNPNSWPDPSESTAESG